MSRVEMISSPERRRWSEDQNRAIVVCAVARRVDVVPGLIYRWRQEFRRAAVRFTDVSVTPDEASTSKSPALEVEFGRDIRLRIPMTTPKDLTSAVMGAGGTMIPLPSGVRGKHPLRIAGMVDRATLGRVPNYKEFLGETKREILDAIRDLVESISTRNATGDKKHRKGRIAPAPLIDSAGYPRLLPSLIRTQGSRAAWVIVVTRRSIGDTNRPIPRRV
jgi:transposase